MTNIPYSESDNETEDNFAVSYTKRRRVEFNSDEPQPGPSGYSPASPSASNIFNLESSPTYLPASSPPYYPDVEEDSINIRMPPSPDVFSPARSFERYRTRMEYNFSPPRYSPVSPQYAPERPLFDIDSPPYSRASGYRYGPSYSPTQPSFSPVQSPPFRINGEQLRPFDPRRRF